MAPPLGSQIDAFVVHSHTWPVSYCVKRVEIHFDKFLAYFGAHGRPEGHRGPVGRATGCEVLVQMSGVMQDMFYIGQEMGGRVVVVGVPADTACQQQPRSTLGSTDLIIRLGQAGGRSYAQGLSFPVLISNRPIRAEWALIKCMFPEIERLRCWVTFNPRLAWMPDCFQGLHRPAPALLWDPVASTRHRKRLERVEIDRQITCLGSWSAPECRMVDPRLQGQHAPREILDILPQPPQW
ncbi:hypothetical protein Bbelb_196130 [Branchiostoma belcheri]|nr:hypothetical protein Bbelb_196130 [Branchiostoma belcheri]